MAEFFLSDVALSWIEFIWRWLVSQNPGDDFSSSFIDGDTVVKQSSMAWILPAFPWAVILSVAAFTDFLTMGILPVGLAMLVVLPRYYSWRGSKFILTDKKIIAVRSGFGKTSTFDILISSIQEFSIKPGMLGGPLGYRRIDLKLSIEGEDKVLPLTYIPVSSPIVDHLTSRGVTLKAEPGAA